MPYEVYKLIHLVGIMMLFLSVGAALYSAFNKQFPDKKQKRPWLIVHGVAMFLVLLGGFGLLARLGVIGGFPPWIWLKLVIWGIFGGAVAVIFRKADLSKMALVVILVLGAAAAYLGTNKPMF